MYYDEEYFHEPSEFEIQVHEFKQALMKSVKEEFLVEMDQLRKENTELQSVKKNFEQIKNDYEDKKQKLEYERKELIRTVRRERLSELLKDLQVVMYRADCDYRKPPKCEKCDEKRKIPYLTPLGKQAHEDCDCNKSYTVYVPEEQVLSEFRHNNYHGKEVIAWYKPYSKSEDDGFTFGSSTHMKIVYDKTMKFEEISRYETFFRTKEECQAYCDWLNLPKATETTESA